MRVDSPLILLLLVYNVRVNKLHISNTRDEELKRQNCNYWDLWQATPFMTTKQMALYAVN